MQTQRSQHQPRVRTLDAMRIEYRGKEQKDEHAIDDVRERVVEPIIEHQDDEAKHDGRTNPDDLHTRTSAKAENIIVTIRVTGTTDTDPSKDEQCQIDAYRPPVE